MPNTFGQYGMSEPYTYRRAGTFGETEEPYEFNYDALIRSTDMNNLLWQLGLPQEGHPDFDPEMLSSLSLADPDIIKGTQFGNPMYRGMLTDLAGDWKYNLGKQAYGGGAEGGTKGSAGRGASMVSNQRTRDYLRQAGSSGYTGDIQNVWDRIGGLMGASHERGANYLTDLMTNFYLMDYSQQLPVVDTDENTYTMDDDSTNIVLTDEEGDEFNITGQLENSAGPCSCDPSFENIWGGGNYCGEDICDPGQLDIDLCAVFGTCEEESDIRLKENIELVGKSPLGINIYEFDYKNKNGRYRGVMADELDTGNGAVLIGTDGYLRVDYSKVDVDFEQIN